MPISDLSGPELIAYAPALDVPEDLDEFWAATLAEARDYDMRPSLTPVRTNLAALRTYDVSFPGYGGHAVRAWLHLPATMHERLPAVVQYQGYGGGRVRVPRTSSAQVKRHVRIRG